jgi:hypothetical protein
MPVLETAAAVAAGAAFVTFAAIVVSGRSARRRAARLHVPGPLPLTPPDPAPRLDWVPTQRRETPAAPVVHPQPPGW